MTKLQLVIVFLIVAITASAQKQQTADNLSLYREFVSLGKWYLNTPLQMKVQIVHKSTPSVQDSTQATMLLYYSKHDFYLQAGEIEQIVNDSLTVLVNNDAKVIKVFSNSQSLEKNMQKSIPAFVSDSSLEKLAALYTIETEDKEKNRKEIIMQSRALVSGTSFSKEAIAITYLPGSQQPVVYLQYKRNLVPIDSASYTQMNSDPLYAGRLVKTKTSKKDGGNLFFVIKERITECRFIEATHDIWLPPVVQQNRVVKNENGAYVAVNGFEDYQVTKEF